MVRAVGILSLALMCACGQTAEDAARELFAVSGDQPVDTATIRIAALSLFPIGTPESQIVDYLKGEGVTEAVSEPRYFLVTDSELVVRFDDERRSVVTSSYSVRFAFNESRTVTGVEVERWLTGP